MWLDITKTIIKNDLQNKNLQIHKISGLPIITTWCLTWLQSKKLSPVAEAYLAFVQSNKEKIIKERFDCMHDYLK